MKDNLINITNKFEFDELNLKLAAQIISNYPVGKQASGVLALLDLAQRQVGGWLPRSAINYVANFLQMAEIRVYEIASFYTMFNLRPVGKNFIQVCGTTPCWLRGAEDIKMACEIELQIKSNQTTTDNQFTLVEVECLGACVNAPVVQINDDYYEDLDPLTMKMLIDDLKAGRELKPGSQQNRQCSAPIEEQNEIS